MSDKQVAQSARTSSAARAALRRGTVVVHCQGPTIRQALLNAWNDGKIHVSALPKSMQDAIEAGTLK